MGPRLRVQARLCTRMSSLTMKISENATSRAVLKTVMRVWKDTLACQQMLWENFVVCWPTEASRCTCKRQQWWVQPATRPWQILDVTALRHCLLLNFTQDGSAAGGDGGPRRHAIPRRPVLLRHQAARGLPCHSSAGVFASASEVVALLLLLCLSPGVVRVALQRSSSEGLLMTAHMVTWKVLARWACSSGCWVMTHCLAPRCAGVVPVVGAAGEPQPVRERLRVPQPAQHLERAPPRVLEPRGVHAAAGAALQTLQILLAAAALGFLHCTYCWLLWSCTQRVMRWRPCDGGSVCPSDCASGV